jgi:Tol biopolymer transport system component
MGRDDRDRRRAETTFADEFDRRRRGRRATGGVSRNASWDGDPAWSPDGRWIVFTRRTGHAEISVMRPDGSDQRRLRGLAGIANECCLAWRPG